MSQSGPNNTVGGGAGSDILTISGNSGGAVGPDMAGNVTFTGNALQGLLITGDPPSSALQLGITAEDQIIYVGKAGNNTWDGTNIAGQKLTIGAGLTAASALTPSSSNVVAVVVLDGGTYAENISVPSFVKVFAPNAILSGSVTLADNSAIQLYRHVIPLANVGVTKSAGANQAVYICEEIDGTAAGIEIESCTSGTLFLSWKKATISNASTISSNTDTGTVFFNFDQCIINTGSNGFYTGSTSTYYIKGNSVSGAGNVFVNSNGTVYASITNVSCTDLITIVSGTVILDSANVSGAQTLSGGTFRILSGSGIENVVIGATTPAAATFTTLNATTGTITTLNSTTGNITTLNSTTINNSGVATSATIQTGPASDPEAIIMSTNTITTQGSNPNVDLILGADSNLIQTVNGVNCQWNNIATRQVFSSASAVVTSVTNNGAGQAAFSATGSSGGGDVIYTSIVGAQGWSWGIDNSTTNDDWALSKNALGTNNSISIDGSAGNVTLPSNSSFFVGYRTTVSNVTGNGTEYFLVPPHAYFNVGSNFDTGTGIYTCPVLGKYCFIVNVLLGNVSAANQAKLYITNVSGPPFFGSNGGISPTAIKDSSNQALLQYSAMIFASAADQIRFSVTVSGEAGDTNSVIGDLVYSNTSIMGWLAL